MRESQLIKHFFPAIVLGTLISAAATISPSSALAHGGDTPDLSAQKQDPGYKRALAYREDLTKLSSELHSQTMRLVSELQLMPKTGYPERDFAQMLIQQNQNVVEMAELGLKYGKNPELRVLTGKLAEQRKDEIQKLRDWVKENTNLTR